jgi:esterase/lipase
MNQPMILFQSAHDGTIAPNSCELIKSSINSIVKIEKHMKNSGHAILLYRKFDQVVNQTWAFIENLKIL